MNSYILNESQQNPQICDRCLGSGDDEVRMNQVPNGATCKICTLPYTLYHFKQKHRSADIIKTLICTNCAKQRNVCQCCMLDMTWHIPIQLRDQIISMVNGSKTVTEEAKNIMMKRFLAMKDGNIGGAQITSDGDQVNEIMNKLRNILENNKDMVSNGTVESSSVNIVDTRSIGSKGINRADISNIWNKFPLDESFPSESEISDDADIPRSFFIYNVDSSIPEWKIADAITNLLSSDDWKKNNSVPIVVNHKARCGGIRVLNPEKSKKLIRALNSEDGGTLVVNKGTIRRGVLKVENFSIFIIPWKKGFGVNSFGEDNNSMVKIASLLKERIIKDLGADASEKERKANKVKNGKVKKKSKKRVTNLKI
ncbi:hypothetical protein RNJ44_01370 [Nakaseomyces bracarensis]|uniref:Pre-mRNA-splicing factor SLT11 n=1 Tax=Nakaseomyces bracarensis TaxID=273131 RepID=A0ABR4NPQ7_9SACH